MRRYVWVPSLKELCEKRVVELRCLEVRHYDREVLNKFTHMIPHDYLAKPSRAPTSCIPRDSRSGVGRNVRETKKKWKERLDRFHTPLKYPEWYQPRQAEQFDKHNSLFNLAFQAIVKNLQENKNEDLPYSTLRTSGRFYNSIWNSIIPRYLRDDLKEWRIYNIMYERFYGYFNGIAWPKSNPCSISEVLWAWHFHCFQYKGLKYYGDYCCGGRDEYK